MKPLDYRHSANLHAKSSDRRAPYWSVWFFHLVTLIVVGGFVWTGLIFLAALLHGLLS